MQLTDQQQRVVDGAEGQFLATCARWLVQWGEAMGARRRENQGVGTPAGKQGLACLIDRSACQRNQQRPRQRPGHQCSGKRGGERVDGRQVARSHVAQVTRAGILAPVRPFPLLLVLFVAVPVAEIVLFVVVGGEIGVTATIAVVLITAFVGASLVTRQSRGILRSVQLEFASGRFPGKPLAHGAMVLVAGALLLTPGFLTDAVGFLLLTPPVREALRLWALRRYGSGRTIVL